jgi:hypothetical protein
MLVDADWCLVAPLLINASSRRFVVHNVGRLLACSEERTEQIYFYESRQLEYGSDAEVEGWQREHATDFQYYSSADGCAAFYSCTVCDYMGAFQASSAVRASTRAQG